MSEANETGTGESNASLFSGSARKAPANDPDVQGTAALPNVCWRCKGSGGSTHFMDYGESAFIVCRDCNGSGI